jgi:hypothetical protein
LPPLLPTIAEGCLDHQACLFGKQFSQKLVAYLKSINRSDLIAGMFADFVFAPVDPLDKGKFKGFKLLKILSIYYGIGPPHKGNEFDAYAKRMGVKKKIFFYISKNRYLTYELLARAITDSKNNAVIESFMDEEKRSGMEGMLIASLIRIIPRSFFEGLPSSND